MSSRATKRRIWRRVHAKHFWWWVPNRDAMQCRCGASLTGMEIAQLGDVRATWRLLDHVQDAYRAEQRREARRT